MSGLHVVAVLTAAPGSEADLKAALETLVPPTRAEAGCVSYFLHVSAVDPAVFVTVETWTSQAALEAHMKSEHLAAAGKAMAGKLAGAPQVHPLVPIDV
jgi:quinol monooxygenase YgiN